MKLKLLFRISILFLLISFTACHSFFGDKRSIDQEKISHHSAYDDSTLNRSILPVMMPYNRLIDPAGKVISFGSPNVENHSLDLKPIPGTDLIAIEDRFGIALLDKNKQQIVARWSFEDDARFKDFMSTYSGLEVTKNGSETHIFWSAADGNSRRSVVFEASWNGKKLSIANTIDFKAEAPAPLALPNEIAINPENGKPYLYVVLNGNNTLVKIDLATKATVWSAETGAAPYGLVISGSNAFVTNWGGNIPAKNSTAETAGVPYGSVYTDPKTGATNSGSVQVFDLKEGKTIKNIAVGLHPNDLISNKKGDLIYVTNSNSDDVSVISTAGLKVVETIPVKIKTGENGFIGDSPNALTIDSAGENLYVANGMDNAVAVIKLGVKTASGEIGKSVLKGFIPTEAYPGGLIIDQNKLYVTNLEGEGARINSKDMTNAEDITAGVPGGAYNSHRQKATISIIDLPDANQLSQFTKKVKMLMLDFRTDLAKLSPRKTQPERPIPERIGEPSIFKHVIYIIKENRTYDQVLGDLPQGKGAKELCVYGDSITPNQHQLAKNFGLLDNYYASGKCSAEGHQWTDAAMVTDYVEKNVRAWFRSYPHVQTDAMVYNKKGFIWNNAADHGKSVRIYGEACIPTVDPKLTWTNFYENYKAGKPLVFKNITTISRVKPMLSPNYPGSDYLKITDQIRAAAFINELKAFEKQSGDQFPNLSVLALSTDHTTGSRPGMPTPRAMVADNDLALGRIIEAVSKSRFWKNTVIFVTEDDSQAGWDHVSAYRTTGFVVSPYSKMQQTISVNYNQTSMVRSIEQILGIPPMNLLDATALPMFACFNDRKSVQNTYIAVPNKIPLNEMNRNLSTLKGKALLYAKQSMRPEYDHIDGGNDDVLNRILWYDRKGNKKYPAHLTGKADDDDD